MKKRKKKNNEVTNIRETLAPQVLSRLVKCLVFDVSIANCKVPF